MSVTFNDRLADQEPRLVDILSLTNWRRLTVETIFLLAATTLLQRRGIGLGAIPGLPHLYWIPVLLAVTQYGMSAGVIATIAASLAYWLQLSPPSAAQDYYAYVGSVALQPALWLGAAIVLGGLRNLQIHQFIALAGELAGCRRCASDLADGLERAAAEINALEARIAADANGVAGLSRGLSLLDLKDRRTAVATYCEVFRAGTGAAACAVYLKQSGAYIPVCVCEDGLSPASQVTQALSPSALEAILAENRERDTGSMIRRACVSGYEVVPVPPTASAAEPMAAIVYRLSASQDTGPFRRRAEEMSRGLAAILAVCPDQHAEACR